MFKQHIPGAARITKLLALAILAVAISSCGRFGASPGRASIATVMQAVHDYGRGHQVLPPPAASTATSETEEGYRTDISLLLAEENFAELEKIAAQNRAERGLFVGGVWKNNAFFNAAGYPAHDGDITDSNYKFQIRRIEKWIAAYPQSSAARITLARAYTDYADLARGDGAADTVADVQWDLYHERSALATDALLAAARLGERDSHWYEAMQQVAFRQGWTNARARDLLDQAVAFEPSYYHYYREYADYLRPQWYGKPGAIPAFAEEASARLPEPDSSILYFRIVSSLACNCAPEIAEMPGVSLPKIRDGYANVQRLYGFSNLNANRFAIMAVHLQDKSSAQQAFASITTMEHDVWWGPRTFEAARTWANTP
ncbi:MAG TPA: DUF4034 domain-containing protein [Candidatus Acidoferrales bacterium]|nr:DUF4034 domain-containing protein [Candidatus Acidoferrales bacterium]